MNRTAFFIFGDDVHCVTVERRGFCARIMDASLVRAIASHVFMVAAHRQCGRNDIRLHLVRRTAITNGADFLHICTG